MWCYNINLVNHEAWIEYKGSRAYFKWGHLPNVDGKFDPKAIKRAFIIDADGNEGAVAVGLDEEASSEGGLFIEFNAEKERIYIIAVEYDRGIYTVTEDRKWIFGEKGQVSSLGYAVDESRWICGFAKAYAVVGDAKGFEIAGFEFEIVSEIKKFKAGEKLKIQLLFRGRPVEGEVNIRNNSKLTVVKTDGKGFAEVELGKGVNVISARYVDELTRVTGICDKRNITTTLTIVAE